MKYVFATTVLFAVSERAHDVIWALVLGVVALTMLRVGFRR